MTIPNLITNYQKKVTVSAIRKVYSTLLQAARSYQADFDEPIDSFDTSLSAEDFMKKYFIPYLKVSHTCSSVDECWKGGKAPIEVDRRTNISITYGVALLDGTIIAINKGTYAGIVFYVDIDGIKGMNRSGRDIFNYYLLNIDTPHYGANVWPSIVSAKGLRSGIYPGGYGDYHEPFTKYNRAQLLGTSIHRSCNKSPSSRVNATEGNACTAVIMKDGWTIAKDYPW